MTTWERFEASLETTDPREITYDVSALRDLAGEERAQAVALLADRIAAGDVRAIETALATPLPELAVAIGALGPGAAGPAREAAARALARFGDLGALEELVARLATGHPIIRINAAYELSKSDEPIAVAALLRALVDTEVIVRVHAMEGLNRHYGLSALAEVRHSPLGTLFVLVCTDIPVVTARGADAVRAIAARLDAGATATELGLDVPPPPDDAPVDAFVASMRDDASPIDVGSVQAMSPLHRAWATAIIVAAAERKDPRVPAAVAALGEPWAIDAIRSVIAD